MGKVSLDMEGLSEDERRALRVSKFSSLGPSSSGSSGREYKPPPRMAHPGGTIITNKAAALSRFLERKLATPGGAAELDPELVQKAVESAKAAVLSSKQGGRIRHVEQFDDGDFEDEEGGLSESLQKEVAKKAKQKKNKSQKERKKRKVNKMKHT